MYKHRLKIILNYYEGWLGTPDEKLSALDEGRAAQGKDIKKEMGRLLRQIGFFSHERLVHLIVMSLVALAVVITIPFNLMLESPALMLLSGLLLVLLFPYIVHYFHLENGVQALYKYYDKLEMLSDESLDPIYDWQKSAS